MRFEKTRKGVILGLATALLAGGVAFGAPAPAQAPPVGKATVVTEGHQSPDRTATRASRSSNRTTPPQKKNIVVKKQNSVVKKAKPVHKKAKVVRKKAVKSSATHTQSGRKMTSSSAGNRALGKKMAASKGWTGRQWYCLEDLWSRESQWSTSSGSPGAAYGIPQALPGSKMSSAGPGWRSNAATQIKWGLKYIDGRYGTPCSALNHFRANTWY